MIRLRSGRCITAIMRNAVRALLGLLTENGVHLKTEDGKVLLP